MITLDDCIKTVNGIVSDAKYSLKNARSPMRKRGVENTLEFFESLADHLRCYKQIKEGHEEIQK